MIETPTVIFVDVLGFAPQVLQDDGALNFLDAFYNSSHSFDELQRDFDEQPRTIGIERLFGLFHVGLEEEIAAALRASHLHSIVFSDSAFVAFEHPIDALLFCQKVMRKMIGGKVPVRMGVAHGSFKPLRFKTDLAADVTLHSSYFLGSGVVKAHHAESSGVSGLRILLHRDFPVPPGWDDSEVLPLTTPDSTNADRLLKFGRGADVVDRELAYLIPHLPLRTLPDDFMENDETNDQNRHLFAQVNAMRSQANESFRYHYDDTLRAIEQMRLRLELPSLFEES